MDASNWVYAIPLAAIIGGVTIAIFAMYFMNKKDISGAPGTDAMGPSKRTPGSTGNS